MWCRDIFLYRLATMGLGVLLLSLSAFVLIQANASRMAADALERDHAIAGAFDDARHAAGSRQDFRQALERVRTYGDARDRAVAREAAALRASGDREELELTLAAATERRGATFDRLRDHAADQDDAFTLTLGGIVLGLGLLGLFGTLVRRLQARRRRAEEESRAHARNIATVSAVARSLSFDGPDARGDICVASRSVSGAAQALLFEPDGHGSLVSTAMDGIDIEPLTVPLTSETATSRTFITGEPTFVARCAGSDLVAPSFVVLLGSVSALWQPVKLAGSTIGVLAVSWDHLVEVPSDPSVDAIGLLAEEASVAIDRADLVTRLRALARVDADTGLMNEAAFVEELPRELARARRDDRPVSIAVLEPADDAAPPRILGDELRDVLRVTDDLARDPEGRFLAILPTCDAAQAEMVLGRLLAAAPPGSVAGAVTATWTGVENAGDLLRRAREHLGRPSTVA